MAFSMSMSANAVGAKSAFMGSKLRLRAPVRTAPIQKVAARAAAIPGEQLVRQTTSGSVLPGKRTSSYAQQRIRATVTARGPSGSDTAMLYPVKFCPGRFPNARC